MLKNTHVQRLTESNFQAPPSRGCRSELGVGLKHTDLNNIVVAVFSVHSFHSTDVQAAKHLGAGVDPHTVSEDMRKARLDSTAKNVIKNFQDLHTISLSGSCLKALPVIVQLNTDVWVISTVLQFSKKPLDQLTCQSLQSVPTWLNPCWPSSYQKWTFSWKSGKKTGNKWICLQKNQPQRSSKQLIAHKLCLWSRTASQGRSYHRFISIDHYHPHLQYVCVKASQTHSIMLRAGGRDEIRPGCFDPPMSVKQLFGYGHES